MQLITWKEHNEDGEVSQTVIFDKDTVELVDIRWGDGPGGERVGKATVYLRGEKQFKTLLNERRWKALKAVLHMGKVEFEKPKPKPHPYAKRLRDRADLVDRTMHS